MLRILFDRFPNVRVIFRPAKVQGDGSANEIAQAIADLNRDGRAEVIIVGRGGGSLEDLWAFNEEVVARAIFRSGIAVISAVGHEIDYTIADFVADHRAPTPTAAAQMVVPSMAELKERIASNAAALVNAMERELAGMRETVDDLGERIRHPGSVIADARDRVESTRAELDAAIESRIDACRSRIRELRLRLRSPDATVREMRERVARLGLNLAERRASAMEKRRRQVGALAGRLDALSPLKVLDRGYAVVTNLRDSHAVLDAASVQVGDELDIRLAKGRLTARTIGRAV
jgi:exodeoxyribonuclease VII large subunit